MTFVSELLGALRSGATFPYQGAGRNKTGRVPCCILEHTTDATAAALTYTLGTTAPFASVFETEALDTDDMHTSSAPGTITIRYPGVYDIEWLVEYAASATAGGRDARLLVNGTLLTPGGYQAMPSIGAGTSCPVRGVVKLYCAAGTTLQVQIVQGTGGNLDMINARFSATLAANT